jgi:hypothetical protein
LSSLAASAAPAAERADGWFGALQDDVRADIAAGKPVVVQVHVPLCDNSVLRCGSRGLGDGNDLRRNLYWATAEGLAGWMDRPGSGWTIQQRTSGEVLGDPDILEMRVWRRELPVPRAWAGSGMPARFTVHLVGLAWRGTAIDRALSAYLSDLFRDTPRAVPLPGGASLNGGGAARIVAWVGHNRLMDVRADWPELMRSQGTFRKGTIAVACYSASYLRHGLPAPTRVPLLLTTNFVMASSAALEGAVMAFLTGGTLSAIESAGAAGYSSGQRRPLAQVKSVFINPSDRRW